jgi:hypothetical protein
MNDKNSNEKKLKHKITEEKEKEKSISKEKNIDKTFENEIELEIEIDNYDSILYYNSQKDNINHNSYLNNNEKKEFEINSNKKNINFKVDMNTKMIPPNNINIINNFISNKKIKNEENVSKFSISDNLDSQIEHENSEYLKINKKKKEWKSWCLSEKELFYEAIANGVNYSSLQKLFKNMTNVNFFIIFKLLKFFNIFFYFFLFFLKENWNKKY